MIEKAIPDLRDIKRAERALTDLEFIQYVVNFVRGDGNRHAADLAEADGASQRVVRLLRKTAMAGQQLSDGDGLASANQLQQAFQAEFPSAGFIDAMMAGGMFPGEFFSDFGFALTGPAAAYTPEGMAGPVARFSTQRGQIIPSKAMMFLVGSKELFRHSRVAEPLFERLMTQGLVSATDAIGVELLQAMASQFASAGLADMSAKQTWNELRRGVGMLRTSAGAQIHLGLPPDRCKQMALTVNEDGSQAFPDLGFSGGRIGPLQVTATDALTNSAILADATAFVGAVGSIDLRTSEHASIEMASDPSHSIGTGSPNLPVESTMVSMWQSNSKALRATRDVGFFALRDDAVVEITGILWGQQNLDNGSPPTLG